MSVRCFLISVTSWCPCSLKHEVNEMFIWQYPVIEFDNYLTFSWFIIHEKIFLQSWLKKHQTFLSSAVCNLTAENINFPWNGIIWRAHFEVIMKWNYFSNASFPSFTVKRYWCLIAFSCGYFIKLIQSDIVAFSS